MKSKFGLQSFLCIIHKTLKGVDNSVLLQSNNKVLLNPTVDIQSSKETHVESEHGAGGVLLGRQLLQVLVEQLKKWQVEQTDPGLLVLKHSHTTR